MTEGAFVQVSPWENLNPAKGATQSGDTLEFGLTVSKIDAVWSRIQSVIADVDAGKIRLI